MNTHTLIHEYTHSRPRTYAYTYLRMITYGYRRTHAVGLIGLYADSVSTTLKAKTDQAQGQRLKGECRGLEN